MSSYIRSILLNLYFYLWMILGQDCVWNIPNVLEPFDLSQARGFHAHCIENTTNSVFGKSYIFTPCGNFAICDNEFVMASVTDRNINEIDCSITSMWDYGTTQPSISFINNRPAITFKYTNGNKLDCVQTSMTVIWICDPNMPPPFGPTQSTNCYSSSECDYTIEIPTPYACLKSYSNYQWYLPNINQDGFDLSLARGYHAMCFNTTEEGTDYGYNVTPGGNWVQCGGFGEPPVGGNLFDTSNGECDAITLMWYDIYIYYMTDYI